MENIHDSSNIYIVALSKESVFMTWLFSEQLKASVWGFFLNREVALYLTALLALETQVAYLLGSILCHTSFIPSSTNGWITLMCQIQCLIPWKEYTGLEPKCSAFENELQFSSVTQSCPTLCNPMNLSTPGLPVHHQLPEFTQTHVHQVSDAIQPSHPLSSPSPPAPNSSQHQSLIQWVNSSHEVAKVLEFQL